jgi:hypothetical protein
VGTDAVQQELEEAAHESTYALRPAASTSRVSTGADDVFITCTAVATIACASLGATKFRSIAASANAPAAIKPRFKNNISFLL